MLSKKKEEKEIIIKQGEAELHRNFESEENKEKETK